MLGRKFFVLVSNQEIPHANNIFENISNKYRLKYIGVYENENKRGIYIHLKNETMEHRLRILLNKLEIQIQSIEIFTTVDSEYITSEKGIKPNPHGKGTRKRKRNIGIENQTINIGTQNINNDNRVINNINNIHNEYKITLNQIGDESMEHITPEFMKKLLEEHHGFEVVFRFGSKLYSLNENMNFRADSKKGLVVCREGDNGSWKSYNTDDGFRRLLDILQSKNEEAVDKVRSVIPAEDLEFFDDTIETLTRGKKSQDDEIRYHREKFCRDNFKPLSANIQEQLRCLAVKCGKKVVLQ